MAVRSSSSPLTLVLIVSLALSIVGIDWGLPSDTDWSVDAVDAQQVLRTYNNGLASGWLTSYPPLHARLLAVVWGAVRPLAIDGAPPAGPHEYTMPDGQRVTAPASPERVTFINTMVTFTARGVSVLMALGSLVWVYAIGRCLWSPAAGVCAAMLLSWTHVFIFYSHVSNREIPQLFWLAGAVYFFVRCAQHGRLRHYVGMAVFAALAGTTKDQALGMLPLMGLSALWWVASEKPGPPLKRLGAALTDRRILAALGVFLLVFAANHDLWRPAGWSVFADHVRQITGPDREGYRQFDLTPAGEWGMFVSTCWMTVLGVGAPLAVGGVLAIGASLMRTRKEPTAPWLLAPAVSYYVFFLGLVLYVWVRWTLPLVMIGSLFAGRWLVALWRLSGVKRWPVRLLVVAALAATLWHGASASVLMATDCRYEAEEWIADWAAQHAARRPWVLTFAGPTYLPRWRSPDLYIVPVQRVPGPIADYSALIALLEHGPPAKGADPLGAVRGRDRYLIVIMEMDLTDTPNGRVLRQLVEGGRPGFALVKTFQSSVPLAPPAIACLSPTVYVVAPTGP
jgi:4-amino-4-deoxy-L-arabinose transferase-like glycosyltransferase